SRSKRCSTSSLSLPPRQSLLARQLERTRLRPGPNLKTKGLASEATPVEKAGYYRYRYGGYYPYRYRPYPYWHYRPYYGYGYRPYYWRYGYWNRPYYRGWW
ncbi:MAG: hypothetical protein ABW010_07205, partial [Methyloceanibacter sp.]